MDTSLLYVEMCRSSYRIQSNWKFELGDYFGYHADITCVDKDRTHGVAIVDEHLLNSGERYAHWIWLPRQDQLQEMILTDDLFIRKEYLFCKFVELYGKVDMSGEQLWLDYVMREKYGERWDGSGWEVV